MIGYVAPLMFNTRTPDSMASNFNPLISLNLPIFFPSLYIRC